MGEKQTTVDRLPPCDLCFAQVNKLRDAYADARLSTGGWAFVCREHFTILGCKLGFGEGQRLILRRK